MTLLLDNDNYNDDSIGDDDDDDDGEKLHAAFVWQHEKHFASPRG